MWHLADGCGTVSGNNMASRVVFCLQQQPLDKTGPRFLLISKVANSLTSGNVSITLLLLSNAHSLPWKLVKMKLMPAINV